MIFSACHLILPSRSADKEMFQLPLVFERNAEGTRLGFALSNQEAIMRDATQ